jgi:hypothetical protein
VTGKVEVENVNHPGQVRRVDAQKYAAIREVMLRVTPNTPPGLTQSEMTRALKEHAPRDLFPAGDKAGWWGKTVQLDLEAKGLLRRDGGKPLRWTLVG